MPPAALRPPRPAPVQRTSWGAQVRRDFFATPASAVATVVLGVLLGWCLVRFIDWALVHAVWAADADRCQAARGTGACWGVIREKGRLVLLGRYPWGQEWRAIVATLALVLGASAMLGAGRHRLLLAAGPAGVAVFTWLMGGGFGLEHVGTDLWGGLPLTLFLTIASLMLAFPLAIVLALGRRSDLPAVRSLCIAFIEAVRGVPLISVLFMASFMLPLLLPPGRAPDTLLRVVVGIALFAAAYMAEVVRGGLQSIPRAQWEAAASIGLSPWQIQRKVILPQALAAVLPALMNNCLSLLKDTSLVTIVSLYELTGALSLALGSDPAWRPYKIEASLFIGAIYFGLCFALSRASLRLERRLATSHARHVQP
jgi:general L-amino acid transport system permease protein